MNLCFTCKHWEGDKQANHDRIFKCGSVVMDWKDGFPEWGKCGLFYEWLEVTIRGDAATSSEIPANFGCILHEESS